MKVLLLLKEEIKVNIENLKKPVLTQVETTCDGIDVTYEAGSKHLRKAVKMLSAKDDVKEIVISGCSDTEEKFRKTYGDLIAFLEKDLNRNREGLPAKKKIPRKKFDISPKDKALFQQSDVSKLEIAYAKFKPKVKSCLYFLKSAWKYAKKKTYYKKKIVVFENEGKGYVFFVNGIDFIAVNSEGSSVIKDCEQFLEDKKQADNYDNKNYIVRKYDSKVKRIIENHIPLRTDERREVIRKTVQNIAVVVFTFALIFLLYNSVYKSVENTAIQSEIQSIYYDGDTSKTTTEKERVKNFEKLKKINKEIVGWITVPNTKIDYPVLYHKGDDLKSQYYLYNNHEGVYSKYGAIFIDFRSQQNVNSKNVIMHGHHMDDGSMFANLLKYGKTSIDMDFYKTSPTFTLATPDEGDQVYKIFAVIKTTGNKYESDFFNYLQGDFGSDAEFMNFIYNLRVRSMVNAPVDINETDSIATLSTCSYEVGENYRTVIVGRKVRDGESKNVNTSLATKNSNAYFPASFYYRYGGEKPKISNFKTAYKKGEIDWYDGKGKLKGKQDLTGGKFVVDKTSTTTKDKTSSTKETKPKYFVVKFLNANGSVIKTQKVEKGKNATAPKAPSKASTKDYRYKFRRWDKSYTNVSKDLVIKPIYSKVKIPKPTKPKATKPKVTKPTKPKVTKPKATKPKPTKPKPTKPKPATRPTTKPTTVPKPTEEATTQSLEEDVNQENQL